MERQPSAAAWDDLCVPAVAIRVAGSCANPASRMRKQRKARRQRAGAREEDAQGVPHHHRRGRRRLDSLPATAGQPTLLGACACANENRRRGDEGKISCGRCFLTGGVGRSR